MNKKKLKKCPDCGGDLKYYHNPGITRVVCRKKCKGYKVLEVIVR